MQQARPVDSAATTGVAGQAQAGVREMWNVYIQLTKARLNTLVLITTLVGFIVASTSGIDWLLLGWTLTGTVLAAFGSAVLNQVMERRLDALMKRTAQRPLPAGRVSVNHALLLGLLLSAAGVLTLLIAVNALTALLALIVILTYTLWYTPLKLKSSLCTVVGAICGAIPPMMGWTAVRGQLDLAAWSLGAILFAWQIPHFLALAWMYRDEYERAGFRMLPSEDQSGRITFRMLLFYSLLMLPVAATAVLSGIAGWLYMAGSMVLGLILVAFSIAVYRDRSVAGARRVFHATLLYLPLLLLLMVFNRVPEPIGLPHIQQIVIPAEQMDTPSGRDGR
jgi:protoheme IX farnesyltransferase